MSPRRSPALVATLPHRQQAGETAHTAPMSPGQRRLFQKFRLIGENHIGRCFLLRLICCIRHIKTDSLMDSYKMQPSCPR